MCKISDKRPVSRIFTEHLKFNEENRLKSWWKTSQVRYKRKYPNGLYVYSRWSISIFIREKQVKTTVYNHYNGSYIAVKKEKWYSHFGIHSWQCLVKLSTCLPCEPAIPVVGVYPKGMNAYVKKNAYIKKKDLYRKVYSSFIHNPKAENNKIMLYSYYTTV